jgi:hypothetical protein
MTTTDPAATPPPDAATEGPSIPKARFDAINDKFKAATAEAEALRARVAELEPAATRAAEVARLREIDRAAWGIGLPPEAADVARTLYDASPATDDRPAFQDWIKAATESKAPWIVGFLAPSAAPAPAAPPAPAPARTPNPTTAQPDPVTAAALRDARLAFERSPTAENKARLEKMLGRS